MKENKQPLVSVLMPVHNGAEYLSLSLDSILHQIYAKYEVIMIDDSSTDETAKIMKDYAQQDNRFKYYKINKQSSVGEVLNEGLKWVNGKYIARLDHDDIMLPARLETQVNFMEKNPQVAVVGSHIILINDKGTEIGKRKYRLEDSQIKSIWFTQNPFAHPATMIKTDILNEFNGYPTSPKNEDYILWFIIGKKYKLANIDEFLTRYRIHTKSVSMSNLKDTYKQILKARNYARNKLKLTPTTKEMIAWNLQNLYFKVFSFFPTATTLKLFELWRLRS